MFLHCIRQLGFTDITHTQRLRDHDFGCSLKSNCLEIASNCYQKSMLIKKRTTPTQIFQ